jgi:hypothetical protein
MANESKQKTEYADAKFNTRTVLTGLWITLVLLYLYCDIFTIFRPNHINEIIEGKMGPFQINQISLLVIGILMALPALMVAANLLIKPSVVKWINFIAGIIYTLVNIGNLIGEKWGYYIFYGLIELLITIVIIITSIKWPKINDRE